MRSWLKRVERRVRGSYASFELLDGTRFYYNPRSLDLFMHWSDCLRAGNPARWPAPPEAVRKVTEARAPEAALALISGGAEWMIPYDLESLTREREIRPRSLVAGRPVDDQDGPDLSEPE